MAAAASAMPITGGSDDVVAGVGAAPRAAIVRAVMGCACSATPRMPRSTSWSTVRIGATRAVAPLLQSQLPVVDAQPTAKPQCAVQNAVPPAVQSLPP